MMPYSYRIHRTIDACVLSDWDRVCELGSAGVFMTPTFLSVLERTLGGESRFWHVIIYDGQSAAVACATLSTYSVDLLIMAGSFVRAFARRARMLFPELGLLKVLFCGVPYSGGQRNLAVIPSADRQKVIAVLERILTKLSKREDSSLIVYKEFDSNTVEDLNQLLEFGYRRVECPSSYDLSQVFNNFDEYRDALKSHYRNDIRRSERKAERAKLRCVHLRDPAEIIRAYTPDAHKLYLAVVGKSKVKLEILPMQFFAELTRSFPGALSLSLLLSGDKLVAFNWGLFQDRVFYYLFCGLDYGADADIYFNLMYRQLDYAFRRSPKLVSFGQTAESFKARLGCQAHARYAFVRGNKFAIKLLLKYFSCIIFRKPDPSPHYSVFKYQGSTTQPARGHSDNILDLELK